MLLLCTRIRLFTIIRYIRLYFFIVKKTICSRSMERTFKPRDPSLRTPVFSSISRTSRVSLYRSPAGLTGRANAICDGPSVY